MRTSETLNLAADLIQRRGWSSGVEGWGGGGALCLEGAITAAADIPDVAGNRLAIYQHDAYWAVAAYLDLNPLPRIAPIKGTVWGWNDSIGRTAAEVIEVLRACAVIEAAREDAAKEQTPTDVEVSA